VSDVIAPLRRTAWSLALVCGLGACGERTIDAVRVKPSEAGTPFPGPDLAARGGVVEADAGPPAPPDAAPTLPEDAAVDPDPADAGALDAGLAWRRSCAEIRALDPGARDGVYTIDPDGPGGAAPISVTCDMTNKGGGWTRVAAEDFAMPGAATAFSRSAITTCGAFGSILGGYKTFGNDTVTATFPLRGVPHAEVRLTFELIVLDSWDSEVAFADLDGKRVWMIRCDKLAPATCNQTSDQCGWTGTDRLDGKVPVDLLVPHTRDVAQLSVGAILDQGSGDESWGLDNVAIYVR
jgi:hypothetical protein